MVKTVQNLIEGDSAEVSQLRRRKLGVCKILSVGFSSRLEELRSPVSILA